MHLLCGLFSYIKNCTQGEPEMRIKFFLFYAVILLTAGMVPATQAQESTAHGASDYGGGWAVQSFKARGLKSDNVADTFAAYWMSSWAACRASRMAGRAEMES
jgi:hypothetical protein